jgi:UDP-N-acetylmuramate--alanine ligase
MLYQASRALEEYSGAGRRFDVLGTIHQVTVVNDYAHHPTEIRVTLTAARARYPEQRIWAVWQPHTFSRTLALLGEFIQSFSAADRVIVTEIYPAREQAADFAFFSAAQVVAQMDHPYARFFPSLEETQQFLLDQLQPGDVLIVLSAGDAERVSAGVFAALKEEFQRQGNQ